MVDAEVELTFGEGDGRGGRRDVLNITLLIWNATIVDYADDLPRPSRRIRWHLKN
jgi:hypothetical protein